MNSPSDPLSTYRAFAMAAITPPSEPIPDALRKRLHSLIEIEGQPNALAPVEDASNPDPRIPGFLLEAEIGRGGMGIVFRAWDEALRRYVAIKVLSPTADPEQNLQFQRESQAAATVRNDHVVPIYSVGRTPHGRSYLVMPLIVGQTLRDRIRSGPLSPRESAALIREVAIGLAALHSAGLLHRDIKPANVLLDAADGRAKLTDFGLARSQETSGITRETFIAGTPEYMSPEQATAPESLDIRSDIYSLGVTLYECLTGTIPFRGTALDIIRQRGESEAESPRRLNSAIPRDLETICLKAIARDRARRYGSAADFAADLDRWMRDLPITARPTGWAERTVRWMRRNPLPVAILAIGLIGTVVSTLGWNRAAANARLAEERRESAEAAALAETTQRERAEQHLATARSAVDRFYLRVIEEGLLGDPKLQVKRRDVLTDAARFYQKMLALETADAQLRNSASTTANKLGLIFRDLGRNEEAESTLRRSVQLAREILQQNPSDGSAKLTLFTSLTTLRIFLWGSNQFVVAAELDQECIALSEELLLLYPENLTFRRDLAAMNANRAGTALKNGELAVARLGFLKARMHFEELLQRQPGNYVLQADLARTEFNLGFCTEDLEERIRCWELSRKTRREIQPFASAPELLRHDLVKNCIHLAKVRMERREYQMAMDSSSEAVQLARVHLKEITDVPMKLMLANSLHIFAEASAMLDRIDEADRAYRDAGAQFRSLLLIDSIRFLDFANAYSHSHSQFLKKHGRIEEAKAIRGQAVTHLDRAMNSTAIGPEDRARLEKDRKLFSE